MEDLTTFTKWGAQQAKITLVGTDRSVVTQLLRSDEAILYKDYGVGYFDLAVGIEHNFDFLCDDTSYGGGAGDTTVAVCPWALTNDVNDFDALWVGNKNFIVAALEGDAIVNKYILTLYEVKNAAVFASDTSVNLNEDQQYWVKITIVGNAWTAIIYPSLADRTNDTNRVDTLSVTLSSAVLTFQYFYSVMSRDNYPEWITTWQENYYFGGLPEVITRNTFDVTTISAELNGEITSIGDSSCDERGFDWGTVSGVYPESETENGTFGVGIFNLEIDGLASETIYYYRVKVHNDNGWVYGTEKAFSTQMLGEQYLSFRFDWDSLSRSVIDWRVGIRMKFNDVEFLRSSEWATITGDSPNDSVLGYNEKEFNGWIFPVKHGYVIFLERSDSTTMIAVSYSNGIAVLIRVLKSGTTLTFPKLQQLSNIVTTGSEDATTIDLDQGEYALFYEGDAPTLGTYLFTDRPPYDTTNGLTYQIRFKHLAMTGGGIDENIILIGTNVGNDYIFYFYSESTEDYLDYGFLPFLEDYNYCNTNTLPIRNHPNGFGNFCFRMGKSKWHDEERKYVCGNIITHPYSLPYVYDNYIAGKSETMCFLGYNDAESYEYHVGIKGISVAKDEMLNWVRTIVQTMNIDTVNRITDTNGKIYLYVFRPLKMGHESGNSVGFMVYHRGANANWLANLKRFNGAWVAWNPAGIAPYGFYKPYWGVFGDGAFGNNYGITIGVNKMFKGHFADVTPEIFAHGVDTNVDWIGILTDQTDGGVGVMTRKNVYGYYYRRKVVKDATVPAFNPDDPIEKLSNEHRGAVDSLFLTPEYPLYDYENDGLFSIQKQVTINGQFDDEESGFSVPIKIINGDGVDDGDAVHPLLIGVRMLEIYMTDVKNDFSDVLFVDNRGLIMPFGMERKVNGDYAIFWVKVSFVPKLNETTSFYIYSGAPAQDYSGLWEMDVGVTFYDDFEGGAIDVTKWTLTGVPTLTTDQEFEGSQSLEVNVEDECITSITEYIEPYNLKIFCAFRPYSSGNKLATFFSIQDDDWTDSLGLGVRGITSATNYVIKNPTGAASFTVTDVAVDWSDWVLFMFRPLKLECKTPIYIDGVIDNSGFNFGENGGRIRVGYGNGGEAGDPRAYYDYVVVIKSLDSNPLYQLELIQECPDYDNQIDCEANGCNWCCVGGVWVCQVAECPICSDYDNQVDCEACGCCWYDGTCYDCAEVPCEYWNNQVDCEDAGCYWYNGTCHSTPQDLPNGNGNGDDNGNGIPPPEEEEEEPSGDGLTWVEN